MKQDDPMVQVRLKEREMIRMDGESAKTRQNAKKKANKQIKAQVNNELKEVDLMER